MGLTKKQHEVLEFIKKYSAKKGYAPTQREIKDHFGLKSYGSVQRYLKYLKDDGYLTQDWNAKRGLTLLEPSDNKNKEIHNDSVSLNHEVELPLLGDVAAGNPIEALENPTESITVPSSLIHGKGIKGHFALRVRGESMIEDGILDGDVAIIRQTESANTGQTIVAVVDGEATLKKFYKKKNKIELHPANSTMSPIIVSHNQEIKIVGQLIGLFRSYV